jgi:hypothetical protein
MTDQPADPQQLELEAKMAEARKSLVQTQADTAKLIATLARYKAGPPRRGEYPTPAIWRLARSEHSTFCRQLKRDISDRQAATAYYEGLLDLADGAADLCAFNKPSTR